MPEKPNLNFATRGIRTVLPVDTTEFPLRLLDWRRLYRKVRQIPEYSSLYSNLTFFVAGVSASAGLALIPLYQSVQAVDTWIKPTFWAVFIAAGVLAVAFFAMSRRKDAYIKSSCQEVLTEMTDIHQCYFPGELIEPPISKPEPVDARFAVFIVSSISVVFCAVATYQNLFNGRPWFIGFGILFAVTWLVVLFFGDSTTTVQTTSQAQAAPSPKIAAAPTQPPKSQA